MIILDDMPFQTSESPSKPKLDLTTDDGETLTQVPLESPAGSAVKSAFRDEDGQSLATKSTTDKIKDAARNLTEATSRQYAKAKEYVGDKVSSVSDMALNKGLDAVDKVYDATMAAKTAVGARTKAAKEAVSRNLTWSKEKLAEMRKKAMEKYPSYFPGGKLDKDIEIFQRALTDGSEPVELKKGETWQLPFVINVGDTIRWEFCVLKYDVYFKVALRIMGDGGSVEEETRPRTLAKCGEVIRGSYNAYMGGQVIIAWDNKHSWFRTKHIAYSVSIVRASSTAEPAEVPYVEPSTDITPASVETTEPSEAAPKTSEVADSDTTVSEEKAEETVEEKEPENISEETPAAEDDRSKAKSD